MKRPKITIIGAGKVGAATAQRCAASELGDIVLLDIPATGTMSRGKALDLVESGPIVGFDARIIGTESYADTAGSDVVVITAGVPRRPGMSRDDLLSTNAAIVSAVAEQIRPTSPEAVVIVVTNPLDAMAHRVWQVTGFPPARVVGEAGVVDTARFRAFIAAELNVSVEDVSTILLGGHGDSMVPLPNYTCVGGIPVGQLMRPERLQAIVRRTREGGPKSFRCCKRAVPITPRAPPPPKWSRPLSATSGACCPVRPIATGNTAWAAATSACRWCWAAAGWSGLSRSTSRRPKKPSSPRAWRQ